jgi:hypothetical protein
MRAYLLLAGIALTIAPLGAGVGQATIKHQRHPHTAASHHRSHRAAASHRRVRHAAASRHRTRRAAVSLACGGKERWDIKDGSDAGAASINLTPVNGVIADLNNLQPQPIGGEGHRMQEETVVYRVSGILRLFKHDDDGDYHVVLADDGSTPYARGKIPASGHSIVVEVPDPHCVPGKRRQYGPSIFLPQLTESRADFEKAIHGLRKNTDLGSRSIPVTVTGVLFFDFLHGQTGHGRPQPSADPGDKVPKVVELHPVLCNDVNGYREKAGKPSC